MRKNKEDDEAFANLCSWQADQTRDTEVSQAMRSISERYKRRDGTDTPDPEVPDARKRSAIPEL